MYVTQDREATIELSELSLVGCLRHKHVILIFEVINASNYVSAES